MMEEGRIVVAIETQTFRFTPSSPIDHQDAVSIAGGTRSGPYVVVSHEQPRATFVVEPEGSVLVHGIGHQPVLFEIRRGIHHLRGLVDSPFLTGRIPTSYDQAGATFGPRNIKRGLSLRRSVQ